LRAWKQNCDRSKLSPERLSEAYIVCSASLTAMPMSPSHLDCSAVQRSEIQLIHPTNKANAGLAPLLLTLIELIRQLMEAQVIRQMEAEMLTDADLERAAESLRKLEEQVVQLCEIFEINPADLNVDLGEIGTLLPANGYYPGKASSKPTVLELLDRLLHTGVVLEGDLDLGLAQLNLIHAKLRLVLTSRPIVP